MGWSWDNNSGGAFGGFFENGRDDLPAVPQTDKISQTDDKKEDDK